MTSARANSGRRSTICRMARRNSDSSSQVLASNTFSIFIWMERTRLQACRVARPRTIEGPLYVVGAPLVESGANLTDDADEGEVLTMSGAVRGPDGEAVPNAILHVWHANSKGFYSHFDPTGEQSTFNNRRRLKLGADGR